MIWFSLLGGNTSRTNFCGNQSINPILCLNAIIYISGVYKQLTAYVSWTRLNALPYDDILDCNHFVNRAMLIDIMSISGLINYCLELCFSVSFVVIKFLNVPFSFSGKAWNPSVSGSGGAQTHAHHTELVPGFNRKTFLQQALHPPPH